MEDAQAHVFALYSRVGQGQGLLLSRGYFACVCSQDEFCIQALDKIFKQKLSWIYHFESLHWPWCVLHANNTGLLALAECPTSGSKHLLREVTDVLYWQPRCQCQQPSTRLQQSSPHLFNCSSSAAMPSSKYRAEVSVAKHQWDPNGLERQNALGIHL